jgi:F-type H+-transporting ATPase subunit alpha
VHGYADDVPLDRLSEFEQRLYDFLERDHPDALATLRETRDLPPALEARLQKVLTEFRDVFAGAKAQQNVSG